MMLRYCCLGIITLFIFSSCGSNNSESTAPDVSHIKVDEVNINRFEQDLFALDTLKLMDEFERLKVKYSEFFPLFLFNIQEIANKDDADELIAQQLKAYIKNKDVKAVYNDINEAYPDLNGISNEFEQAFKYLKYHLPDLPQPQLFSFMAPFQHQALTIGNDKLGIGLDLHLGADYPLYASAGHPQYLSRTFTKENLLANTLMGYAKSILYENRDKNRLIDKMIYQGKLLYLVEQLLPDTDKSKLIGYTPEQYQWCRENETQIWSFWIDKKLLYETQSGKYGRFVAPSPTTAGMPGESPGNVGSWTGWQIVRSYMKNNPETTLKDLLGIEDGQQILKLSAYKP